MFWFNEEKQKKKIKSLTKEEEFETLVWKFFMDKLPRLGFEQREGQEDMALDICSSIVNKTHTVVEAGVGIGKSYAYIVPLLYYNKLFNKPVIIATSTIALQEQLIEDIKRVCSYINYRPEVVLAKGMTHFACKKRADVYLKPKVQKGLDEEAETLYRYIYGGKIDRRFINMDLREELWKEVNVEMTDHSKCKHFKTCRFMELRKDMLTTEGIILCNQDLLTVHLQKVRKGQKGLLNFAADVIVVDEVHNLEEKVRSSLIESFHKEKIRKIFLEVRSGIKEEALRKNIYDMTEELTLYINDIFKEFKRQIQYQIKVNEYGDDIEKYFVNLQPCEKNTSSAYKIVETIYNIILRDRDNSITEDIIEEVENLKIFLKEMLNNKSNYLFWLENKDHVEVFACPKDMNNEIKKLYFDKLKTTIVTSATIADKQEGPEEERYEYFIKNTGFPVEEGFLATPKLSPFPYNKNAMLYYKDHMPHPVKERKEFIEASIDEIVNLLNITKGKALILFTAKSDLNSVYEKLKEKNLGYEILRQRNNSSQDELLHKFRENENSVLLATGTFWEGIDVPGKALSNLIIFKLPFPVPDPILDYKKSDTTDFLIEVSVPLMIVKLRQGVGRLIRKQDDKGIVSILDPRIGDKTQNKYKNLVFNSLPIKKKTKNLNELKEFWKDINKVL